MPTSPAAITSTRNAARRATVAGGPAPPSVSHRPTANTHSTSHPNATLTMVWAATLRVNAASGASASASASDAGEPRGQRPGAQAGDAGAEQEERQEDARDLQAAHMQVHQRPR